MVCKGICIRHKASTSKNNRSHYLSNHKRCQICQIFMKWEASFACPCCGSRLRSKPRNKKYKNLLQNKLDDRKYASTKEKTLA